MSINENTAIYYGESGERIALIERKKINSSRTGLK